jgi:hypothetical protein
LSILSNKFFLPAVFLFLFVFQGQAPTFDYKFNLPKEQKVWGVNLGAFAAITARGVMSWDYFEHNPHAQSEGWFSSDTKEGGADKQG